MDSNTERLVLEEGLVKLNEGVPVGDLNFLADVDSLELVGVGAGEVELDKGSSTRNIAEGKIADKGVNVSLDGAVGSDGGVDLHGELVGLRVEDVDGLDP